MFENLQRVYEQLDNELSDKSLPKVCEKGCSYCCNQKIKIYKLECLNIVKFINNMTKNEYDNLILRLKEYARKETDICPFLLENSCIIYEVRGFSCRSYQSGSKEACKFKNKYEKEIIKNRLITEQQIKEIGCDLKLFPKRYITDAEKIWLNGNNQDYYSIEMILGFL